MNLLKKLDAVEAELDALYKAPITEENEARIADLEEEHRSLMWDWDARIF